MRVVEETETSFSLNFFSYSGSYVSVNIAGQQKDALNDIGKDKYFNHTKDFGIQCGDNMVTSYQSGALLLYAVNLEFDSVWDRSNF